MRSAGGARTLVLDSVGMAHVRAILSLGGHDEPVPIEMRRFEDGEGGFADVAECRAIVRVLGGDRGSELVWAYWEMVGAGLGSTMMTDVRVMAEFVEACIADGGLIVGG